MTTSQRLPLRGKNGIQKLYAAMERLHYPDG